MSNFQEVFVAIDSAIGSSVAVATSGKTVSLQSDDQMGHTESLSLLLQEALETVNVSPEQVTTVVQGVGPGPFTGLRVGMATAESFALGANATLLSLISHDAVALDVLKTQTRVRVVQDAKRRELFITTYSGLDEQGIPRREGVPEIVAREAYVEKNEDFWPDKIKAENLIMLAKLMLKHERSFYPNKALYLRQPDVNLLTKQR